jgi:bifunctional DNA-binding transcriptional regulator/antitoxin component of YhaV-PrlF toxin-antitoxin module
MMWTGRCKIDQNGRITLPKSFRDANNITEDTDVYIQTVYNTDNIVKLVFKNGEDAPDERKE